MSDLELTRDPEGVQFRWASWGVTATLSRYRERSSGTSAELTVRAGINGENKLLTEGSANLSSLTTRSRLARHLHGLHAGPDWDHIVETICVRGLREFRRGEPAVTLKGEATFVGEPFVLNPMLYDRHPTLFYGPGDSGKSFLCLYFALLLAAGGSQNGLACTDWPVLWLDWELAPEDTDLRITMIKTGHPEFKTATLTYRRLAHPLADCLSEVKTTITEHACQVLVIDSVALAAGAELQAAETAIRFHAALRQLGLPTLLIGHTAKNAEEKTPFGSVFFFNLARSVWEVKKTQELESGDYTIGLYHKKNNLGPRRKPLGFHVSIKDTACTVQSCGLSDDPELSKGLPLADQIESLLKKHRIARSAKLIATELAQKEDSVSRVLRRYKGKKWFRVTSDDSEGVWLCL